MCFVVLFLVLIHSTKPKALFTGNNYLNIFKSFTNLNIQVGGMVIDSTQRYMIVSNIVLKSLVSLDLQSQRSQYVSLSSDLLSSGSLTGTANLSTLFLCDALYIAKLEVSSSSKIFPGNYTWSMLAGSKSSKQTLFSKVYRFCR